MVRIQSPTGDQTYRSYDFKSTAKSYEHKPSTDKRVFNSSVPKTKPTFDCYKDPKGPDIKRGKMGPEYKTTPYQHREYRPTNPYKARPSDAKDPLKSKPLYADKPMGMYKGDVTYRLNRDNNAAMRHWKYGFVDDTVAVTGTHKRSKDRYTVPDRPKPKQEYKKPVASKPEQKPMVHTKTPVQNRHTPPPPPVAKSFKTSSTQYVGPGFKASTTQTQVSKTKSFGTQYEPEKRKTMSVQTESSSSPMPVIAPIPITQSTRKVTTKSEGIQCSEKPKQVAVKSTQSESPKVQALTNQTLPLASETKQPIPIQARTRTPQYAEQTRQKSPVYKQRCSPSPEVAPIIVQPSKQPTRQSSNTQPSKDTTEKRLTPLSEVAPIIVPSPKEPAPQTSYTQPNKKAPEKRMTPLPEVAHTAPVKAPLNNSPQTYQQPSPKTSQVKENSYRSVSFKSPSPTQTVQRSKTPEKFIPQKQPVPQVTSYPDQFKTSQSTYKNGNGMLPYSTAKSRLPPEVTACIEAYDVAHTRKKKSTV